MGGRIYSIQSKTHITSDPTASSLLITLDQTPKKGNVLVAAVATFNGYGNIDASVYSMTQGGVTWTYKAGRQTDNKVFDIEIWAGEVTSTSPSSSISITLRNATSQGIIAEIFEYNGITTEVDGTSSAYDTSYSPSSGTANPSRGNELIVAATFAYDYPQNTPLNEFALYDGQRNSNYNSLAYLEKKVYDPVAPQGTGTYCADPHDYGIRPWIGCIVAFKGRGKNLLADDYNCAANQPEGFPASKGITLWGACVTNNYHMAANGGTATIIFTGTHPKGYPENSSGAAVCNVTWDIEIDSNLQTGDDVRIACTLNGHSISDRIHSKIYGHNVTETLDLAPYHYDSVEAPNGFYYDDNTNTLTFANNTNVGVSIKNLRIIRIYSIWDCVHEINDPGPEQVRLPSTLTGSIDSQREDYPCSCENCGSPYSFTGFGAESGQGKILYASGVAGSQKSWTFINPPSKTPSNYVGPFSCLFNFNNIVVKTESGNDDNQYTVSLNGYTIATFYQTKKVNDDDTYTTQAASVDLAKSQWYDDTPNAVNTVTLTNNSGAELWLLDGDDQNEPGRVNIYRVYRTTNNWQDNFNDNSQNTSLWDKLEASGGVTTETSNMLQASIPSGSGNAYAGFVSKYAHNVRQIYGTKQGFTAKVDVNTNSVLDEMGLLISNTKAINADPIDADYQSNWYRIIKGRSTSYGTNKLIVENKIGTAWSQYGTKGLKANTSWNTATGNLKITTSLNSIALFENNIMKYAEPYALPIQDCYIYAFGKSNRAVTPGTGYFDNFEVTPADTFIDTFDDGTMDGWTSDAGSWQVINRKLQSTQSNSYMHINTAFSTNRHVKASMKTLTTSGSYSWYVPWLIVSAVDGNNRIYALIRKDGHAELSAWYLGDHQQCDSSATGLDPYVEHTVAVSIIGNNGKVWVDGALYIDWTHSHLGAVANGYTAVYTYNSTGTFGDIVVLHE